MARVTARHAGWLLLFVWAIPSGSSASRADEQAKARPQGELREIEGLKVLRVWGAARERGFAHGYLLGDEIARMLNSYLDEMAPGPEGAKNYESKAKALLRTMVIAPQFRDELEGMLAGIRARAPDGGRLSRLKRAIEYNDLVALNCIPEIARVGCSSFAAWGPLTADGNTISGRNLDWHSLRTLERGQLLLAQIPTTKEDALSWVSVTWPGFIGCLTGMNSEGVTVSMHDVRAESPSMPIGFTPRGLALRQVIERARAATAMSDGRDVLAKCLSRVGNNVVISAPYIDGRSRPSVVFEYDGRVFRASGVTVRAAKVAGEEWPGRAFQVCTNHYLRRAAPEPCGRYETIDRILTERSGGSEPVDVQSAWEILRSVAQESPPGKRGLLTYHSVVFEPNLRRMHVAVSRGGVSAPKCRPIVIQLDNLLADSTVTASDN